MKPVPRRNIDCIDTHTNCSFWAEDTECETNQSVKKYCPLSCGVGKCGDNNTTNNDKNKDVPNTGKNEQVLCTDDHENCGGWAVRIFILFLLRFVVVDTRIIEIRKKEWILFLHIRSIVDFLMLLILSL